MEMRKMNFFILKCNCERERSSGEETHRKQHNMPHNVVRCLVNCSDHEERTLLVVYLFPCYQIAPYWDMWSKFSRQEKIYVLHLSEQARQSSNCKLLDSRKVIWLKTWVRLLVWWERGDEQVDFLVKYKKSPSCTSKLLVFIVFMFKLFHVMNFHVLLA